MPVAIEPDHDLIDVKPGGAGVAGPPSEEFLARIPHEFARRHLILSTGTAVSPDSQSAEPGESLIVSSGTKPTAIHNVGVALGRPVTTTVAPAEAIASAIDGAYARVAAQSARTDPNAEVPSIVVEGSTDVEGDLTTAVRDAERDLLNTQGKAPTVRLVDLVLFEAVQRGASDVHVQPVRDRTLVRYRLDGALHTVRELPGSLASAVVTRVKVMARLDVAEQRAPQDGRATVTIGGGARGGGGGSGSHGSTSPHPRTNAESRTRNAASSPHAPRRIDLRVSTIPSSTGERVVLRLLDPARSPHLLSFAALGMPESVQTRYLAQAARSHGIVLSTGPTGSGKTTTLYTTLAWLSTTNAGGLARGCELNIMTVEDPVEYDLSGPGLSISQTQVDPKKNVTFATGLKHILRQDPDVIMVGEIRDDETARTAIQASLTGHLVLSTLHTNDAASAVARLLDLGVEPFLVASSLSAVLAQRLVRTTHRPCSGAGCAECLHSGFKGRTGVFELLVMDPAIRELVVQRRSAAEIKAAAQRGPSGGWGGSGGVGGARGGMTTLREAGLRLVREKITTEQELARVIDTVEEEIL